MTMSQQQNTALSNAFDGQGLSADLIPALLAAIAAANLSVVDAQNAAVTTEDPAVPTITPVAGVPGLVLIQIIDGNSETHSIWRRTDPKTGATSFFNA